MKIDWNNKNVRFEGTMMEVLKMEIIETDEPTLEMRMPVDNFNTQTIGVLHGGATIALAETVSGLASNLMCKEGERCFGIQVSASHISSAYKGETVRAVATAQHLGKTTHVWNVDVFSMTDDRLISTVKVTNFVKKQKQ
ncbi:MAG TPA: PaaI family thioesterase [Dysgonomonas sp.]|nr:PaaI family thioesterase [Dysgonomonas sp.]